MTLIPIEHPHRLASPAEAEVFYRGLRDRRVGVRGFHTTDPDRFEALIAAAESKREHTVSFLGGTLDDEARSALSELCGCSFEVLQVRTASASLRVWPGRRAWVEGLAERRPTDLVETKSIAEALDRFDGISGEHIDRGHISNLSGQARAPLLSFLSAARTEVHVVLSVTLQAARSLTELFPGQKLDWQSDTARVDFPDGSIRGFLETPRAEERHRRRWQARIDEALRRAGLI
jgi:hypothetical protein